MAKRRPAAASGGGATRVAVDVVLYVEGPLDRDVLRGWAYRLAPPAGGRLIEDSVILGGRQPERAVADFRERAAGNPAFRGLCVIDRDETDARPPDGPPGLEFVVWRRRHIESYLLVPGAIRRCLRDRRSEPRVAQALRRCLPARDDEAAWRSVDAKRLLSRDGPIARAAGGEIRPGRIARAMRADEFHRDVLDFFAKMLEMLGVPEGGQPAAVGGGLPWRDPRRGE